MRYNLAMKLLCHPQQWTDELVGHEAQIVVSGRSVRGWIEQVEEGRPLCRAYDANKPGVYSALLDASIPDGYHALDWQHSDGSPWFSHRLTDSEFALFQGEANRLGVSVSAVILDIFVDYLDFLSDDYDGL